MTKDEWPQIPDDYAKDTDVKKEWAKAIGAAIAELEKSRRMAPITAAGKRAENAAAREKQRDEYYAALDKLYVEDDAALHRKTEEEMMDVAKSSIERARDSAKFVQIAASAVATIYTGFLGLAFSAAANPLPLRALVPTMFLGLAVALATGYLAFLTQADDAEPFRPSGSPRVNSQRRTDFFIGWARGIAMNRASLLRASVVSFLLGVTLLPVGVLDFSASPEGGGTESSPLAAIAEPTESASPTPWPTPAFTEPAELAAVLYAAQLEEFREPAVDDKGDKSEEDDTVIWILTLAGLGVVVAFWQDWLPLGAAQDPSGGTGVRPRPRPRPRPRRPRPPSE